MKREKSPSLFFPLLVGMLLLFIFLSGINAMASLTSYGDRPDQTKINKAKTSVSTARNVTANFQSATMASKPR